MGDPARKLLDWYAREGREGIPWREDPSPYHVWVSEIMAQQTRLSVVKAYYLRFIAALPSVEDLAEAEDALLVKLWEGLGYYSRVFHMKEAAQIIIKDYGGQIPDREEELIKLPGIGPYTAAAIASIAFGRDSMAMDGNGLRVSSRLLAEEGLVDQAKTRKRLKAYMESIMPSGQAGNFNQAIMDLGSMICQPKKADCLHCPLQADCQAGLYDDPLRFPRKKPKAKVKKERKVFFLIEKDGSILLERRPNQGLLSRMWGLPMADEKDEKKAWLFFHQQFPNLEPVKSEDMGRYQHVFSHVIWDVKALHIWVKRKNEALQAEKLAETRSLYQGGEAQAGDLLWARLDQIDDSVGLSSVFRYFIDRREEQDQKNL